MIDSAAMANALKALLEAQGLTVYLDVVPDAPTYPYVALFFDDGQPSDESLGAQMERSTSYPRMTCAASVPKADGRVSDALYAACVQSRRIVRSKASKIFGQEIVAGGGMVRVESSGSNPPARQDDVPDRLVLYSVETLKLAALAV